MHCTLFLRWGSTELQKNILFVNSVFETQKRPVYGQKIHTQCWFRIFIHFFNFELHNLRTFQDIKVMNNKFLYPTRFEGNLSQGHVRMFFLLLLHQLLANSIYTELRLAHMSCLMPWSSFFTLISQKWSSHLLSFSPRERNSSFGGLNVRSFMWFMMSSSMHACIVSMICHAFNMLSRHGIMFLSISIVMLWILTSFQGLV